jgi:hypothetical protein
MSANVSNYTLLVLTTCSPRDRYCETIKFLYSLPTFDFRALCVLHLPKFILPQRMHLITKIDFNWVYYNKVPYLKSDKPNWRKRQWLSIWENLTGMQGLKSLNVAVHLGGLNTDWQWEEDNILESLEGICSKRLEHFSFQGLPFKVEAIAQ